MMDVKTEETQCSLGIYRYVEEYLKVFEKNNYDSSKLNGMRNAFDDINRALILKHVTSIEEFEEEKKEMRIIFEQEKNSLKKAFENERKEYELELDKLRNGTVEILSELEQKYKKEVKNREESMKKNYEKEKKGLKISIQEQMSLIADVENEIKRILRRLLLELKRFDLSSCEKLQNDLCKNIDLSCLKWLKEIFNENIEASKGNVGDKKIGNGKEMKKTNAEKDELDEVGEVFRKQKKELTEIFIKEKKHLEKQMKDEIEEHKKKLNREYEVRSQLERQVWQETVKECEREIGILKYERQQMDRNYCLEIDRLKLETEKEKADICVRYRKEHESLRRKLSDKVSQFNFREHGPAVSSNDKLISHMSYRATTPSTCSESNQPLT